MRLRQILSSKADALDLISVSPDATVQEAVHVLCANRIGALPVIDEAGALVGIVSERDVLRQCDVDAAAIGRQTVSALMTETVITADPDDELHEIIRKMTVHRIRHLPVMENGRPVAMVSISDVLQELHKVEEVRLRTMSELLGGTYGSRVF